MLSWGGIVSPAFLPSCRAPHLLGRLVFTLTRMTSQPSLLNVGRPVSSSCKIRLVAVMFRTTMISMFLPMKLEERNQGHICHCGHYPYLLCLHSPQLWKGKRVGDHPHRTKKGIGLAQGHKTSSSSPLCFGELLHILQNPA